MSKLNFKDALKKSTESIKSAVDKLPDSVKNIDINGSMKELTEKGNETLNAVKKFSEDTVKTISEVLEKPVEIKGKVTIKDALSIIYFTTVIDREVTDEEMEKYISIGQEMDPMFNEYKEELLNELNILVEKAKDEDYEDNLRDYIRDVINHSRTSKESIIDGKLLVWNLLATAYSDNECSDVERKLIRYTSKQLELDKSLALEMENYVQTLIAIENEVIWLKQSGKEYSIVEKQLNELSDRKLAIMQGVYALLND